MEALLLRLEACQSDLPYFASLHSEHPLPVHHTEHQFEVLRETVEDLLPIVKNLAAEKVPRGRKKDHAIFGSIGMLADIFEYTTGQEAKRTYDPKGEEESGPFFGLWSPVSTRSMGAEAPLIEWAIREVLFERREREKGASRISEELNHI